MPALNNIVCGDQYTDAATIQFAYNPRGGWFVVGDQAGVVVQLQYEMGGAGGRGSEEWAFDQVDLGPGANGSIPTNAIGIRFKNAVAGDNATVTAMIGTGDDPVLQIDSFGGVTGEGGPTTVHSGQVNGVNGTPTPIHAASLPCLAVAIKADPANVGKVYIGDSTVTTGTGLELAPDDGVAFDIIDIKVIFFDVDRTGEGLSWLTVT